MSKWLARQKSRGVKLSLTWLETVKRWRKKHSGGKAWYASSGLGCTAEGYEQALKEWSLFSEGAEAKRRREALEAFDSSGCIVTIGETETSIFEDGYSVSRKIDKPKPADDVHTVAKAIDDFLRFKRAQAEAGSRSIGTWDELRKDLAKAEAYLGADTPMSKISSQTVRDYYVHLGITTGRGGKKLGEQRKHNLFASFKQFGKAYWRREDAQWTAFPKAFDDPELSFVRAVEPRNHLMFTPEEIKQVGEVSAKWKAYSLLMLNCALTQIDLSSLTRSQFNGDRLTHKRRKTRRLTQPPTVCYKLWPETLAALKEAGVDLTQSTNALGLPIASGKDLIFRNNKGGELVPDSIGEKDGEKTRRKWDNLANHWAKLRRKGKVPDKPLKYFRKTGRTMLKKLGCGDVAGLYLGHAPQTMGERHYDLLDGDVFEPLDQATEKLRLALVVAPMKPKKPGDDHNEQ